MDCSKVCFVHNTISTQDMGAKTMNSQAAGLLVETHPVDDCESGVFPWDLETISRPLRIVAPAAFNFWFPFAMTRRSRGDALVSEQLSSAPIGALHQEIAGLEELEDGWYDTDGEAGRAPNPEAIQGVRNLTPAFRFYALPCPHVFPSVDGGVAMEWTLGEIEASIEFGDSSEYATVASWDATTDKHIYEEGVRVDRKFLRDWLDGLIGTQVR